MSALERALEHLRGIAASLPPGSYKLGGEPSPEEQAAMDAISPERKAELSAMADDMINSMYERCGISRVKR